MSEVNRRAGMQPRAPARNSRKGGPKLREERIEAGVSQAEMARRLGIQRASLSAIWQALVGAPLTSSAKQPRAGTV